MSPQAAAQQGGSPSSGLTSTLETSVVYTDTSHSPTANGGDLLLEVRPGFRYNSQSGRLRGSIAYSVGLIRHSRQDDDSQIQNDLHAAFTLEAVERWLYIDAAASAMQSSISAFGQQSVDGSLQRNTNRTEVGTVSVTPTVRGPIGEFATYEGKLDARATNGRRSIAADSTNTGGTLSINSAGGSSRFGWALIGTQDRASFRAGRSTENERVLANLSWMPDPELRLTVRGGQETTNVNSFDKQRYANSGFDAQWTPNERTLANLSTDRRYFGQSYSFALSHRLPLSAVRFSSSRSASTNSDPNSVGRPTTLYQLYDALYTSREPDPALRDQLVLEALRTLGQDPNTTVAGGFINTAVTLQQRNDLSWSYNGKRTTLVVQGYTSSTSILDNPSQLPDDGAVRQRGYLSTLTYRLTPTASASLSGSRLMTRPTVSHAGTDLKSLSLNWTDQLGRRASATLGVRYSVFNSLTDPYRESAATASLSVRF